MKKSSFVKTAVALLVFLLIFLASLSLLRPAYREIDSRMRQAETRFLDELAQSTGLSFSYDSLSPSILRGITVHNIRIYDFRTDEDVLTVKKAVFRYRLWKLLTRDFDQVFALLSVTDVKGEFSSSKLASLRQNLAESRERRKKAHERVQGESGGEVPPAESSGREGAASGSAAVEMDGVEAGEFLDTEQKALVRGILASLPAKLLFKDVDLSYSWKGKHLDCKLGKLAFAKKNDRNLSAAADSGHIVLHLASAATAAVRFSLNGNIVPGVSGSSAILNLTPSLSADYSLHKTQFLVRYADSLVVARSTQQLLPYSIAAGCNVSERKLSAEVELDGVGVLSLLKLPLKNERLKLLAESPLNVKADMAFDMRSKAFSWSGEGGLDLPESLVRGTEHVAFAASGNEKILSVESLSVVGSRLTASLSGRMNLLTKVPDCSLQVDSLVLPNGKRLSFSSSVRAEGRTVHAYTPRLALGDVAFSSIAAVADVNVDERSLPFSFSLLAPSRMEAAGSSLAGTGTFSWGAGRRLTAGLSLHSLFADTLARSAAFFLGREKASRLEQYAGRLSTFVADGSLSLSTDFSDVSYELPSLSVTDSSREGRGLAVSLSGTRSSIGIRQLLLDYGSVHLKATADALMAVEEKEVNFTTSMDVNGSLYDFRGSFAKSRWLNVTGSYGIDIIANLENGAAGSAKILSFPVSFKDRELNFSFDSDFSVRSPEDFIVDIKSLQLGQTKGKLGRSPKMSLSGKLDSMGFIIDSLSYSDINSSNSGKGYVLWNMKGGILESATLSVGMSNEFSNELITVAGDFTNPLHAPLTKENLLRDCYFSLLSDIRGFPLMRLIPNQYADDTFNGSIIASGTVENPYVSAKLENFSLQMGTKPVIVNGTAELLEGDLFVPDLDITWGGMRLTDFTTDLDLTTFNGDASGEFAMRVFGSRSVQIPLKLSVRNADESQERHSLLEKFVPAKFVVDIDSSVSCVGIMNGSIPLKGTVRRESRDIYFATDSTLGVSGSFLSGSGALSVIVQDDKPLHGRMEGAIKKSQMDLAIKDIKGDFSKLHDLFSTDMFALYGGLASGFVSIKGMGSDPLMDGTLLLRGLEVAVPAVTEDHIVAKNMLLTCFGQNIEVPSCRLLVGGARADLSAILRRERWGVGSLDVFLKTVEDDRFSVKMAVPQADIKGKVALAAGMHLEDSTLRTDIDCSLEQGEVGIVTMLTNLRPIGTLVSLSGGSVRETKERNGEPTLWESLTRTTDVIINVNAVVGRKVDLVVNPLLQALIDPGTSFAFSLDSSLSSWSMKGDVGLRGGHITYLSRNFYLRDGLVSLNENEKSFNPLITARAETKERDGDGIVVTLVLEAAKQSFSAFSPRVYSVPARSETEIMAMLGQVVAGDSDNAGSFILSGLDYGIQFTIFKKMENALRDLLNFDIFSMRMNLLQNALNYGRSDSRSSYNGTFRSISNPLGNFLDNASVYIGKYFGDSIYADALLQFTYDEYSELKGAGVLGSGIVFRPEIGVELEAPFANIRWNFAPDLEPLRYGNVPDIVAGNSITLSWRFTF